MSALTSLTATLIGKTYDSVIDGNNSFRAVPVARNTTLTLAYMKQPIFFAIIIAACLNSFGQDQKPKVSELAFIAGRWNIDVEARLSMGGEWEKSKASSTISFTLDSSLIEEDFRGTRKGERFLAKTFFAVNNINNKFQRTFIDSPHGVLVNFEGTKAADSLVFDKELQFPDGRIVILRVVYKMESADSIYSESMRMPQGSNQWDVTGRLRYRRIR